jgi:apolipoprotein N-acyltransferase
VLPLIQIAAVGGVAALSWLVCMPAAVCAERGRARRTGLAAATLVLLGVWAYGVRRLGADVLGDPGPTARLAVVGGHNADAALPARYAAETLGRPPAALTVWPEAALPGYLQDEPAVRATLTKVTTHAGWLLAGGRRHTGRGAVWRAHNSAVLLDPGGRVVAAYDKTRLVPLAESRVPLPGLGGIPPRPFEAGDGTQSALVAGRLSIGPLVCWEAAFPDPARRWARAGVHVLVNLTSDQDLGTGADQQIAFSRFRAVETGRWLVRASGARSPLLIDPRGRLHDANGLDVPLDVPPATPWVRYGDILPWAAILVLGIGAIAPAVRRGCERRAAPRHERRGAPPPR